MTHFFFFFSFLYFFLVTHESEEKHELSRNDGRSEQPNRWSRRALGNNRRLSTRLRPSNEDSIGTRVGKIVDELVNEPVNEWLANIARRVLLSAIIARESELASFLARRERAGSRSRADRIKKNIPGDANQRGGRPSGVAEWTITRQHAEGASSVERRSRPAPSSSFFSLSLSLSPQRARRPTKQLATIGSCFFNSGFRCERENFGFRFLGLKRKKASGLETWSNVSELRLAKSKEENARSRRD